MVIMEWIYKVIDYLRDYRFSRIWMRYFVLLLTCLVLPVIIVSIWYGNKLQENVYDQLMKENEVSLEQSISNIDSVISSSQKLIYHLAYNNSVQYVASSSNLMNETSGNLENLVNMLKLEKSTKDYIDSIYLYLDKTDVIVSDQGMAYPTIFWDREFIKSCLENNFKHIKLESRIKNNHYPYLLTLTYLLQAENNGIEGLIVVNIDVEEMGFYVGSGKYQDRQTVEGLMIFDDSMEELIYSDEYRVLYEGNAANDFTEVIGKSWEDDFSEIMQINGSGYIVSGTQSKDNQLRYLYLTTTEEFDKNNQEVEQTLRNLIITVVVICLILALLLAKWVYKPLQKTVGMLNEMSMLTEWDQKKYVDEIEAIQRSILMAKKKTDNLDELIQERMIILHNAQICALQTQINPHFLFNTLEGIGNAAALLMEKDNIVTEMIYTLGRLMRISFSDERYLVPLSEELEHVNLYMKLIKFRFRDRIHIHIEIPEYLKEERIVKLTLQPLIENAIEHGLGKTRSDGHIWIRGEKRGEEIYLYVTDNGSGIEDEELKRLSAQLGDSPISGGKHIGMRNVNQRIKLICGEEYGLALHKPKEGGLCVTIHYKNI